MIREALEWSSSRCITGTDDFARQRVAKEALAALLAEKERLEEALGWFAGEEAWIVRTDGRLLFDAPAGSVYATPWGFARAALSGDAATEEQRSKKLSKSEQRLRCFTEERP